MIILATLACWGQDQYLKVGLLDNQKIYSCTVEITRGTYELSVDGQKMAEINTNDRVQFGFGPSISVTIKGQSIGGQHVKLQGRSFVNEFNLSVLHLKEVQHEDHLIINPTSKGIQLINELKLEHYVAGVVEAEAGYALPGEYYKLQAILSRTYALKNIDRHAHEGFSVCDKVHCQVYHHRCSKPEIFEATVATNALVVVDDRLQLINTIFHSNCGGETCNSEDVWHTPLSYLRCIEDSFCLNASKAKWTRSFHKKQVDQYFGTDLRRDLFAPELFSFCQVEERWADQELLSKPLPKIRKDLGLRSTFFYVEEQGDSIVFIGRGYGHGVGLCQQGGIEMAKQGYSYVDILKHYYQDIHIINRRAIRFFLN